MPNDKLEASNPFRIFLASPGDVGYERQLAREVIGQLRSERRFCGRFDIQIVAWDQPGGGLRRPGWCGATGGWLRY